MFEIFTGDSSKLHFFGPISEDRKRSLPRSLPEKDRASVTHKKSATSQVKRKKGFLTVTYFHICQKFYGSTIFRMLQCSNLFFPKVNVCISDVDMDLDTSHRSPKRTLLQEASHFIKK